ncbi:MAG TPA: MBL fold metallo-hydrolase [Sphingomicrobium sp.]|jgi:ribonuclease BN (tRNA processing enzyme)|nr:MBL fold metallo-hydrolase [Sphingomicrobium sp.]
MQINRRELIGAGASTLALPRVAFAQAQPRRSKLILLGTKGGPNPSRNRAPAANLLIVDGKPFLIDCPDGTARQLVMADVPLSSVGSIFLTHHHSDHMAGLGAFFLLTWAVGLKTPLTVFGPKPLRKIVAAELEAGRPDIEYRMREEGRPDLRRLVRSVELTRGGAVANIPPVRVSCALVDHYTVPTFAYRFDTPDRSFVFSGDTRPSQALIDLARGADVLVHEVMLASAIDRIADANAPELRAHLVKSHTTTEELGMVAAAAGVRTVVLSHLVPAFPDLTDAMWTEGVRRHFKGEIIVGRDLMEI